MNRISANELIIGCKARIAPTVIFLLPEREQPNQNIIIGDNVVIRDGTIVYGGVIIGDNVTIDHYCIIREGVQIGGNTRLMNFTEVNRDVRIGFGCRISGYLANRVEIGDSTSCFGQIIHNYPEHGDGYYEQSAKIKDNVIVGRLAIISGNVTVQSNKKIRAGKLITEKINNNR